MCGCLVFRASAECVRMHNQANKFSGIAAVQEMLPKKKQKVVAATTAKTKRQDMDRKAEFVTEAILAAYPFGERTALDSDLKAALDWMAARTNLQVCPYWL